MYRQKRAPRLSWARCDVRPSLRCSPAGWSATTRSCAAFGTRTSAPTGSRNPGRGARPPPLPPAAPTTDDPAARAARRVAPETRLVRQNELRAARSAAQVRRPAPVGLPSVPAPAGPPARPDRGLGGALALAPTDHFSRAPASPPVSSTTSAVNIVTSSIPPHSCRFAPEARHGSDLNAAVMLSGDSKYSSATR